MEILINTDLGYVEVEGIKYSFNLFRKLGLRGLRLGATFKLLNRDNIMFVEEIEWSSCPVCHNNDRVRLVKGVNQGVPTLQHHCDCCESSWV